MLAVGTQLGPYQIVAPLGAGGMGEVFRARDCRLDREVAIKVLPEQFARDPDRLARFEREAKAVAALSHPNLVVIHDFGSEQDVCFAVMELLEGATLRCRLERSPLPWRKALKVALALAEGLAAAHSKGIVHRDLKPENIFLTVHGRVKILDFGLARVEARAAEAQPWLETVSRKDKGRALPSDSSAEATWLCTPAQPDPPSPGQTHAGVLIGTVGYMSPEQARSQTVDARSDLFALGCVLYEMLTGQRAFARATVGETLTAIVNDEPLPLSAAAGKMLPSDVERVVQRCLTKNPEQRLPSARELAFALRAILSASASSRHPDQETHWRPRNAIESLAVLPLVNASDDAKNDYLSDGITESLINILSQLPKLRVMARNTVFRYKGREMDAREVGRELNVRAVLTGRLLQRGSRLIIRAELVNAADGAQLWGEQYDREMSEIFAIEEAISKEIAEKLRLRLTGEHKKRLRKQHPADTETYQLYLKGRYHWNKRTEEGFRKSIELFEQALAVDPSCSRAWAGLADSYHQLGLWGHAPPTDACSKGKRAAQRALEIDDALAEAHTSLAVADKDYDWDFEAAERSFRRALELNPNYALAHQWYGECLACMGRHSDAIDQLCRAQELDPLSLNINAVLGRHGYYFARQYDRAIVQLCKTLDMEANFWIGHNFLGWVYLFTGQRPQAVAAFQRAKMLDDNPETFVGLGYAYAAVGDREQARKELDGLKELTRSRYVAPVNLAIIHIGLGENDEAFAWLDKAYEDRSQWLSEVLVDPAFDPLRPDPRFTGLLRRMNFPQGGALGAGFPTPPTASTKGLHPPAASELDLRSSDRRGQETRAEREEQALVAGDAQQRRSALSGTSVSLLARLRSEADTSAWQRLVDLYTPLLQHWLRRANLQACDIDDVVQEVLVIVVRKVPGFQHDGRPGSFRAWLRAITVNRLRDYWRARQGLDRVGGQDQFPDMLAELEDQHSGLSRLWDEEHDRFVLQQLMDWIEAEFKPATWQAFRRHVLDGQPVEAVAQELHVTANAVFIAKSRVTQRLREEARDLVDDHPWLT